MPPPRKITGSDPTPAAAVAPPAVRRASMLRPGGEDRRRRILDAATAAFAEQGLAGARVDDIATRAAVNKRMLYHYFGNKEALYLAVLEQVYADLLAAEDGLDLGNAEPIEGMRRLVTFLWDYYRDHPQLIALLNNENLHRAGHLRGSKRVLDMHSRLISTLESLLARGRATRVFRAGVDPVQLYITCAGLAYFYLSNCHTLSTIFGRDLMAPRAQSHRLAHITEVVLGYLAPA